MIELLASKTIFISLFLPFLPMKQSFLAKINFLTMNNYQDLNHSQGGMKFAHKFHLYLIIITLPPSYFFLCFSSKKDQLIKLICLVQNVFVVFFAVVVKIEFVCLQLLKGQDEECTIYFCYFLTFLALILSQTCDNRISRFNLN